MNIDNTKKLKRTKDYFDDNFEVIYQEDKFSALLQEEMAKEKKDDSYKDVLASLSEIDHTDYIRKNRTNRYQFLTRRSVIRQGADGATRPISAAGASTTGKSVTHTNGKSATGGNSSSSSKEKADSLIMTIRRAPRKFIRKIRNTLSSK